MEQQVTFESAMTRLEEIVSLLETGKCTLDESLKLFEEGTHLTAFCSDSLRQAEQKFITLTDKREDS
ncbi:MAG: exodeoxyribonuclease VII small subunit [Clostridia bacterium]|nr:exodeoxyribonuclease VII small subunit [Clostridia bacterium]